MGKNHGQAPKGVSQARLHQPATGRPVQGVAKINHGNGTFSMKRTGR